MLESDCATGPVVKADLAVVSDRPRHVAASGLAGSLLADRFCFWRGRSGRRYVFSVYKAGTEDGFAGMPRYADAVVLAVQRSDTDARRIVRLGQTGGLPELAIDGHGGFAASGAADELHVHLLASGVAERAAVLDDLGGEPPTAMFV